MPTPFATVKDRFGSKEELVAAIEELKTDELWIPRLSSDQGGAKTRGLKNVSNTKLLRLHGIFTSVKAEFGSREKLIGSILELKNKVKDAGYKQRLEAYPVPRLYDMYRTAKKRQKQSAASAAG